MLILLLTGPPDPPSGCGVRNHTRHSLVVTCRNRGFSGGTGQGTDTVSFHIEVTDRVTGRTIANQTKQTPKFRIV